MVDTGQTSRCMKCVTSTPHSAKTKAAEAAFAEADVVLAQIADTLDEKKQDELWRKVGEINFTQHKHIPLFWNPVEVMYDPKIVGDYIWKNQRPAFANAGQWGLFKVLPIGDQRIKSLMPQAPPTKTAEGQLDEAVVSTTSYIGR